jgi:3-methyladenine DNA glycosylase/8-oxoguanine DNA glycosylase
MEKSIGIELDNVQQSQFTVLNVLLPYWEQTPPHFYELPSQPLYHNLICLLLNQRISFQRSRQIRQKLLDKVQEVEKAMVQVYQGDPLKEKEENAESDERIVITAEAMNELTDEQLKLIGIGPRIIACIRAVTVLERQGNLNFENIDNIPGIGPWTSKAIRIMNGTDSLLGKSLGKTNLRNNNIFLFEDAWIRARLATLIGQSGKVSEKEAERLSQSWPDKTKISRFLWRLKETGAEKMRLGLPLLREDFIN